MSKLTRIQVYDWWKINAQWLERYIRADQKTSWGTEDATMVDAITKLILQEEAVDEQVE